MTNDQINRAIAQVLEWKRHDNDFCRDLNAMHHAEKSLPDDIWHVFCNMLARVTNAEDSLERSFICATARQRAEAFLRTLGKWATDKDFLTVGQEVRP